MGDALRITIVAIGGTVLGLVVLGAVTYTVTYSIVAAIRDAKASHR